MKISEANRNTLKSVSKVWLYVIAPIALLSYYYDDAFINGLIENNGYFIITLFLAGAFDAMRDKCAFHYSSSIFSKFDRLFFDGEVSWLNKYKDRDFTKGRRKILGLPYPVVLTDGFHLFKGLQTIFICLSIILFVSYSDNLFIEFILCYLSYKLGFNSFFNWILTKK